jgi:hypothetical protein
LSFQTASNRYASATLFDNPNEIGCGSGSSGDPDERLKRQLLAGEQLHNQAVDFISGGVAEGR